MIKNQSGQVVAFQLISATTGSAVTSGSPTVYVTKDGGSQSSGGGSIVHKGNGQWEYTPTKDETNADHVAFTITLATAVSQTVNVYPVTFSDYFLSTGSNDIEITVDDTGGTLVKGAIVTLTDTDGSPTSASDITNTLGKAEFGADDGEYLIDVTPPNGYEVVTPVSFSVPTETTKTITLTPTTISPASDPSLCNVAVDAINQKGEKVEGALVSAYLTDNAGNASNAVTLNVSYQETTDANGRAVLTLIRKKEFLNSGTGIYVIRVKLPNGESYEFNYSVPNSSSAVATSD